MRYYIHGGRLSYISYVGPGMNPLLRPGDILEVAPSNDKTIWCGDELLFSYDAEKRKIAHRVVAVVHNA